MNYNYNGHKIVVDRLIASMILKIDGKTVDKITGLSRILSKDMELHGSIVNEDGSQTEVTVKINHTNLATYVTLYCDGQEVHKNILI